MKFMIKRGQIGNLRFPELPLGVPLFIIIIAIPKAFQSVLCTKIIILYR